jgi:hypothetical protein
MVVLVAFFGLQCLEKSCNPLQYSFKGSAVRSMHGMYKWNRHNPLAQFRQLQKSDLLFVIDL